MSMKLLKERLDFELGPIDQALRGALAAIPEPCRPIAAHILDSGGKRLRPFLTVMVARLCGYAHDNVYMLAASMEMLHAATLLHDDVLDKAESRRGRAAAHGLFGVVPAILAGDALLATGNAIVASFENPRLTLCYSEATSKTAAGEILEISSLRQPQLTFAEYLEIARGKTACLIQQACVMGARVAAAPSAIVEASARYGENLGLAFQLVDDALDFAPEAQTGKPRAGDLREGKMTPPISLYRDSLGAEERASFDESFIHSAFDDGQLQALADRIGKFAPRARELAHDCEKEALLALDAMPVAPEKEVLRQMVKYVVVRAK